MFNPSPSPPTLRVAIYRTSSIGDVVLASACLDLLSQLAVPVEITWVGRGASLEALAQSWPELRTIEVKRDDADVQKLLEALAGVHFLIDLQCNLRSRWLGRLLRTRHKVPVFSAEKAQIRRSRLLAEARVRGRRKPLPAAARHIVCYQYDMMCDALRQGLRHQLPLEMRDGLESLTPRPRLPVPDSYDPPWRKELRYGAWLAIAPGAAHPTKQTPLELVQEILGKVSEALGAAEVSALVPLGLVFLGDDNDRQAARQIADHLSWDGPMLNLAGRLSLWETAVALREVTCLLSNDSSLAHIGEAVDTPVAVLFGPTIESFGFAPRMRQSRAFSSLTGCRPCSKHGKVACRYHDKLCFAAISLDDVAQHLVALLTSADARHTQRGRIQTLATTAEADTVSRASDHTPPGILD